MANLSSGSPFARAANILRMTNSELQILIRTDSFSSTLRQFFRNKQRLQDVDSWHPQKDAALKKVSDKDTAEAYAASTNAENKLWDANDVVAWAATRFLLDHSSIFSHCEDENSRFATAVELVFCHSNDVNREANSGKRRNSESSNRRQKASKTSNGATASASSSHDGNHSSRRPLGGFVGRRPGAAGGRRTDDSSSLTGNWPPTSKIYRTLVQRLKGMTEQQHREHIGIVKDRLERCVEVNPVIRSRHSETETELDQLDRSAAQDEEIAWSRKQLNVENEEEMKKFVETQEQMQSQEYVGPSFPEACVRLQITNPESTEKTMPWVKDDKFRFKPHQVTGICWMLQQEEKMQGGILADMCGLGKTIQTLGMIKQEAEESIRAGTYHGPTLIICPSGTIDEWRKTAVQFGLDVHQYYGFKTNLEEYREREKHIVPTKYLEAAPQWKKEDGRLFGKKRFERLFQQDKHDSISTNSVFLSTPKAWTDRTLKVIDKKKRPAERYQTHFGGLFWRVVVDEAHILRNGAPTADIKSWWAVYLLKAPRRWMVTATPLYNRSKDLAGLLHILWQDQWLEERKRDHPEKMDNLPNSFCPYTLFARDDPRTIFCLRPDHYLKALKNMEVLEKHKIFSIIYHSLLLRRTYHSSIVMDNEGTTIRASDGIPPYLIETIFLDYEEKDQETSEELCMELMKKLFFRAKIQGAGTDEDADFGILEFSEETELRIKAEIYRRLSLAASSLIFERLIELEEDTSLEAVQNWKYGERNLEWLHRKVRQDEDVAAPCSRVELLKFMCQRSAKMSMLCRLVNEICFSTGNVAPADKKLLIFVHSPITQWFLESFFTELEIPAISIHSYLEQMDRQRIIEDFNTTDYPTILICEYAISGVGINLQPRCSDCILFEPSITTNGEIQAWGRIRRIGQKEPQHIYRLVAKNSFNVWQLANQQKKFRDEVISWGGSDISQHVDDLMAEGRETSGPGFEERLRAGDLKACDFIAKIYREMVGLEADPELDSDSGSEMDFN